MHVASDDELLEDLATADEKFYGRLGKEILEKRKRRQEKLQELQRAHDREKHGVQTSGKEAREACYAHQAMEKETLLEALTREELAEEDFDSRVRLTLLHQRMEAHKNFANRIALRQSHPLFSRVDRRSMIEIQSGDPRRILKVLYAAVTQQREHYAREERVRQKLIREEQRKLRNAHGGRRSTAQHATANGAPPSSSAAAAVGTNLSEEKRPTIFFPACLFEEALGQLSRVVYKNPAAAQAVVDFRGSKKASDVGDDDDEEDGGGGGDGGGGDGAIGGGNGGGGAGGSNTAEHRSAQQQHNSNTNINNNPTTATTTTIANNNSSTYANKKKKPPVDSRLCSGSGVRVLLDSIKLCFNNRYTEWMFAVESGCALIINLCGALPNEVRAVLVTARAMEEVLTPVLCKQVWLQGYEEDDVDDRGGAVYGGSGGGGGSSSSGGGGVKALSSAQQRQPVDLLPLSTTTTQDGNEDINNQRIEKGRRRRAKVQRVQGLVDLLRASCCNALLMLCADSISARQRAVDIGVVKPVCGLLQNIPPSSSFGLGSGPGPGSGLGSYSSSQSNGAAVKGGAQKGSVSALQPPLSSSPQHHQPSSSSSTLSSSTSRIVCMDGVRPANDGVVLAGLGILRAVIAGVPRHKAVVETGVGGDVVSFCLELVQRYSDHWHSKYFITRKGAAAITAQTLHLLRVVLCDDDDASDHDGHPAAAAAAAAGGGGGGSSSGGGGNPLLQRQHQRQLEVQHELQRKQHLKRLAVLGVAGVKRVLTSLKFHQDDSTVLLAGWQAIHCILRQMEVRGSSILFQGGRHKEEVDTEKGEKVKDGGGGGGGGGDEGKDRAGEEEGTGSGLGTSSVDQLTYSIGQAAVDCLANHSKVAALMWVCLACMSSLQTIDQRAMTRLASYACPVLLTVVHENVRHTAVLEQACRVVELLCQCSFVTKANLLQMGMPEYINRAVYLHNKHPGMKLLGTRAVSAIKDGMML